MKRIKLMLLLSGVLHCSAEYYTVNARDGLYVREKPHPQAKNTLDPRTRGKVLLRKGEKVRLLFIDSAVHEAHGLEDNFAYVEYRGSSRGYVFKAYLEGSSNRTLRTLGSVLLAVLFCAGLSLILFRYRTTIRAAFEIFCQWTREAYARFREKQKTAQELREIEAKLRAEKEKKSERELPLEKSEKKTDRRISNQMRGVKWLLFFILLALFAINNPSKSEFASMIRENVAERIDRESDDLAKLIFGAGKVLGVDVQRMGIEAMASEIISKTRQVDCVLFTLYLVPTFNRPIVVIGILRKFVPITSL